MVMDSTCNFAYWYLYIVEKKISTLFSIWRNARTFFFPNSSTNRPLIRNAYRVENFPPICKQILLGLIGPYSLHPKDSLLLMKKRRETLSFGTKSFVCLCVMNTESGIPGDNNKWTECGTSCHVSYAYEFTSTNR